MRLNGGVCLMTAKQILDAFSETLMQDERILSPRERELLTDLLQNSRTVASANLDLQAAVNTTIARAVGETVAQRAFSLLGESIVEQILARSGVSTRAEPLYDGTIEMRPSPQPPNPTPGAVPRPPSPIPPNVTPAGSPIPPNPTPGSPRPPSPQPPNATKGKSVMIPVQQETRNEAGTSSVGILERPEFVQAECVVLDEFLAPQELEELTDYVLEHETDFENSEIISPAGELGILDYSHRRSRVLMDLGKHQEILLERIRGVLPVVFKRLRIEEFPVTRVEAQITASNDGDFFAAHSDDSHEIIASRKLTFVYFFNREPRQFEGGELLLHDTRCVGDRAIKAGSYQAISPQQNQIVFFPCSALHEIRHVRCESRAFADSRFTLNGWLHK
jgi:Rps23 Pro-64 3,4-dihydroxylase Tpa1-like proline 4-hydroxylase